jgi:WD40 repeat protein
MDTFSTSTTARQSLDAPSRASLDSIASTRTLVAETNNRFQPPPKRAQTFGIGSSRTSGETSRPALFSRSAKISESVEESEEEDDYDHTTSAGTTLSDYPDSSQANRRPPRFRERPHDLATKYETKLFAICGEFVCTSGYITRVWSLLSGELLMSLVHGDTVKVTALAFKPAKDVEDEGLRIWLGTNTGELHEVDIPTQSVITTKSNAHTRMMITKIHRQASEMWSLDEEGKLLVWPTGDDGLPSLSLSPHVCRVPKGATFSIIVGNQLWIAYGKEIWVFQHTASNRTAAQVLQKPLVQTGVGEVTAGTIVSSQADRIYFGHIDGKVTIYSRKDYSCLGIVNVSLYKISSLVGVGDYLWAGFNTGMIYVYDTTTQPWKVKKDWKAHENTIAGILVDRTSLWKLDRLQVASLGTDGLIRIWDGMLKDDWLGMRLLFPQFQKLISV